MSKYVTDVNDISHSSIFILCAYHLKVFSTFHKRSASFETTMAVHSKPVHENSMFYTFDDIKKLKSSRIRIQAVDPITNKRVSGVRIKVIGHASYEALLKEYNPVALNQGVPGIPKLLSSFNTKGGTEPTGGNWPYEFFYFLESERSLKSFLDIYVRDHGKRLPNTYYLSLLDQLLKCFQRGYNQNWKVYWTNLHYDQLMIDTKEWRLIVAVNEMAKTSSEDRTNTTDPELNISKLAMLLGSNIFPTAFKHKKTSLLAQFTKNWKGIRYDIVTKTMRSGVSDLGELFYDMLDPIDPVGALTCWTVWLNDRTLNPLRLHQKSGKTLPCPYYPAEETEDPNEDESSEDETDTELVSLVPQKRRAQSPLRGYRADKPSAFLHDYPESWNQNQTTTGCGGYGNPMDLFGTSVDAIIAMSEDKMEREELMSLIEARRIYGNGARDMDHHTVANY